MEQIASLFLALAMLSIPVPASWQAEEDGKPVLAPDAILKTPVGGLERTRSTSKVVPVTGQKFVTALQMKIGEANPESNATQLTMPISAPVHKGDALLAALSIRGASADGKTPAQAMLLFERATSPWTKSATKGVTASKRPAEWKRLLVPFTSTEDYAPGEAMVSIRLAFGAQTVEIGGLSVVDYGKTKTAEELETMAAEQNPLGSVNATVRLSQTGQSIVGLGGNFCQPRYGATEPLDPVGAYSLANLHVAHARIGIPLNNWTPERGVYKDEAQAHAALLQMQEMARRKIPFVGSVWEGPLWMLGGAREQSGRTLPPERYADCIEAIAQFLVAGRDKYHAEPAYFSFNEPDYGVNFKFTPAQMDAFIRQAGPRFKALGLKTKFMVGDTANGTNFVDYARPLLADPEIRPYLGPLAFHSWDVLTTPDARYAEIAEMGRASGKAVWCTEAGHDAQLWTKANPWAGWDNALSTALAYEKTVRTTGASIIDYWTYQNNYPIVQPDGKRPYPVFHVMKAMEGVLAPQSKVADATSDNEELHILATAGPRAGKFGLLLINPIGAGTVTLSGLPPGAAVTIEESTAAEQGKLSRATVDAGGRLTVALPTRSVVCVR
jgi:O-glycosyl hydrolase